MQGSSGSQSLRAELIIKFRQSSKKLWAWQFLWWRKQSRGYPWKAEHNQPEVKRIKTEEGRMKIIDIWVERAGVSSRQSHSLQWGADKSKTLLLPFYSMKTFLQQKHSLCAKGQQVSLNSLHRAINTVGWSHGSDSNAMTGWKGAV